MAPAARAPVAALAKELGVTEAKLRAAMQKIRRDLAKEHEAERDAFVPSSPPNSASRRRR